jgi:hypothetical protein
MGSFPFPRGHRLFPSLAYVDDALCKDFLPLYKFHHTVQFSDVPLYVSAISNEFKYAAGTITVNIDKGDTHGVGTVSVDIAPLLRLSIDSCNSAVIFKIIWVASYFVDLTKTKLKNQLRSLESILAAPKDSTPRQTRWLSYFASTVHALFVEACVEEVASNKWDSFTLRVCLVVKKESAEKWMTRDGIEAEDAERWATGSGYPIDLLSITSFSTT